MESESDPFDLRLRQLGAAALSEDDGGAMLARVTARAFGRTAPSHFVGRFAILRRLGRGGMGSVYAAWDPDLERNVALKHLRERVGTHARRREIIEAEARALARVDARNVVQVYETFEHEGALWVVMELIDGSDFEAWQAHASLVEIVAGYAQAGRGLAAAHRAGLVHRDFKPTNVLIRADAEVRVVDFGLALAIDQANETPSEDGSSPTSSTSRSGTRAYMAPEQLAFGNADIHTDEFSFCVALYEAVAGVRPYDEGQLHRLATDPDRPIEPARGPRRVPTWLMRLLARGLSARPRQRWPSMDALAHALERTPGRRRRNAWGLGTAAALATVWTVVTPSPASRSCDASTGLAGVWTAERAAELGVDAQSRGGFASPAMAAATAGLDAYAQRWRDVYTQACRGAWIDGIVPTRRYEHIVACLDRARVGLRRSVELLERNDPQALARAGDVIAALPDPEGCARVGADELDPVDAQRIAASDAARLTFAAGDPRGALEQLESVEIDGEEDGIGAAEVWSSRGTVLGSLGRRAEAEAALLAAVDAAATIDAEQSLMVASRELVTLYAEGFADPGRAATAEALLQGLGERIDLDARDQAENLGALGLAASGRGELELAEQLHRGAIDAVAHIDDPWVSTRARLRLGNVLQGRGRLGEARLLYDELAADVAARLGPEHPELAAIEHARAALEVVSGDVDAAQRHASRALTLQRAAFGVHAQPTATSLMMLAHIALRRGDSKRALPLAVDAWALLEPLPPGHPDRGNALAVLASTHLLHGDYELAMRDHEALMAEVDRGFVLEHPDEILNNLAWLSCRLGRCLEARPKFEGIIQRQPSDAYLHLAAQAGLAMVELAEGAPAAALERTRRTLASVVVRPELADSELWAELNAIEARALVRLGGDPERIRVASSAALGWYAGRPEHAVVVAELRAIDRSSRIAGQ